MKTQSELQAEITTLIVEGCKSRTKSDAESDKSRDRIRKLEAKNEKLRFNVTDLRFKVRSLSKKNAVAASRLDRLRSFNSRTGRRFAQTKEVSLVELDLQDSLHELGRRMANVSEANEHCKRILGDSSFLQSNGAGLLQLLDRKVKDFGFTARATNCLYSIDVVTLGELVAKSDADLRDCSGLGRLTLAEIKGKLDDLKLIPCDRREDGLVWEPKESLANPQGWPTLTFD